jgi:hypothetical protein
MTAYENWSQKRKRKKKSERWVSTLLLFHHLSALLCSAQNQHQHQHQEKKKKERKKATT